MAAYLNYQMDTTRHQSLDSALMLIDRALLCDSADYFTLHNHFIILFDIGRYRECLVTLSRLKGMASAGIALVIADEATCYYLLGEHDEFERARAEAIDASVLEIKQNPDEQAYGQAIMIRARLYGKDDALQYLRSLQEASAPVNHDLYEELVRSMPVVGSVRAATFRIEP